MTVSPSSLFELQWTLSFNRAMAGCSTVHVVGGATGATLQSIVRRSASSFNVTVSGLVHPGSVYLQLPQGACVDIAGCAE